jgi:CheY-like chemotaxis protein
MTTEPTDDGTPRGPRILLVDDNVTNLQVLFQALSTENCELLVAQSGEQALETAGEATPDLILLDVKMPGIDGFETFERLRQSPGTDSIPVIFLSAHADLESVERAREIGAAGYLTKPLDLDKVLALVRETLTTG